MTRLIEKKLQMELCDNAALALNGLMNRGVLFLEIILYSLIITLISESYFFEWS